MTDATDSWSALEAGGADARRVLGDGRYDFFWIINGLREPGLLLQLPVGFESSSTLPEMRNLSIAFQEADNRPALVLILRDREQRELFETLCRDIVHAAEQAVDLPDAVNRTIRRTMRWHHLLRSGRSDRLSPEEQRGLIGELQFLHELIDRLGPLGAVQAWTGPSGSAKDFEMGSVLVEVKARRGAAHPHVQISSEVQLSDVEGARLFLKVTPVDSVPKPNGLSLSDHVDALEKLFAVADLKAYDLWEQALADCGYDAAHDYSDRHWITGPARGFEVVEGFPRIANPVPAGVTGVRYSIALEACEPFAVEDEVLTALISERIPTWAN